MDFINNDNKRNEFKTALILSAKAFLKGDYELIPDKDYKFGGIRNHDSICLGCDNHYNIDGKRGCRIIIY